MIKPSEMTREQVANLLLVTSTHDPLFSALVFRAIELLRQPVVELADVSSEPIAWLLPNRNRPLKDCMFTCRELVQKAQVELRESGYVAGEILPLYAGKAIEP